MGLRKKLYEDAVVFPALKSAGAATLTGEVISDFENNTFGPTRVFIAALDGDAITDDLMIQSYGSWDGGSTYLNINRDNNLTGASDGAYNGTVALGSLIPRVRVDGVFDASGALTATHGATVDVVIEEAQQTLKKEITALEMADDISGVETELTNVASLANGKLLNYAGVAFCIEDSSAFTKGTTIGWKVQTSIDNVNWTDMASDSTSEIVVVDTDAPVYFEAEYTSGLGKYIRVSITGTTGSSLTADILKMYAILG